MNCLSAEPHIRVIRETVWNCGLSPNLFVLHVFFWVQICPDDMAPSRLPSWISGEFYPSYSPQELGLPAHTVLSGVFWWLCFGECQIPLNTPKLILFKCDKWWSVTGFWWIWAFQALGHSHNTIGKTWGNQHETPPDQWVGTSISPDEALVRDGNPLGIMAFLEVDNAALDSVWARETPTYCCKSD